MDMVQPALYEKMVGNVSLGFSDLVIVGIRIEQGMKNGKIIIVVGTSNNNAKKVPIGFQKMKEGETNVFSAIQGRNCLWKKQQQ